MNRETKVRENTGRKAVEPVPKKVYDLVDLVKRITPDNLHELVDFGPPQGREVW
jgi:antitoxin MazE